MSSVVSLLFPGLLMIAALKDITSFTIPNRLVFVMLVLWPLAVMGMGLPLGDIGLTLLMALIVLSLGFALFAANLLGAGDVKLLSAATLWVGGAQTGTFLIYVTLAGAALALILLMFRRLPLPGFALSQGWLVDLHSRTRIMPYGVAIAVGGIIVWTQSGFWMG